MGMSAPGPGRVTHGIPLGVTRMPRPRGLETDDAGKCADTDLALSTREC